MSRFQSSFGQNTPVALWKKGEKIFQAGWLIFSSKLFFKDTTMQLQQRDITNIRAGILQSQKFSVEMNGVLFCTTIDGIYSDKKRAPLRELCTNAWDASPGSSVRHSLAINGSIRA